MKNNRWSVYKDKSKKDNSPKPAAKPSTIGKAGREGAGVGQGRGKQDDESQVAKLKGKK